MTPGTLLPDTFLGRPRELLGAIIVTGVPGVGKTTVMEAAAKSAGLRVVVYGTEMFEVAKARGLVRDRDEMRRLDPKVQRDVQKAAAEAIAKKGDVIVDTHCSIQTAKGYLPGLPAWVLESLKPSTVILVEATAKEIAGRRAKDATRVRDTDSAELIARHQEMNRAFAAAYATLTGATVAVVMNHDDRLNDAIEQILPVVKR